jgi:N-acetyl-anhydromuramyl-L-alanine amidase AmpD
MDIKMKPQFIIMHHSLTEDGKMPDTLAIWNYHVKDKGWAEVGYHYLVEEISNDTEFRLVVIKGRMDTEQGAHCLGYNDKSIGICLIGNYDNAEPSEEALKLLRRLVKSLMLTHGILAENVLGHWETYSRRGMIVEKSCPGIKFNMPRFRELLLP